MDSSIRRTVLLVGATFALTALATGLTAGSVAAASADPAPGLQLRVSSAQSTYLPNDPVRLTVVVTNRGPATCDLLDSADAAVQVLAATRDGKPLTPAFGRALPINGPSSVATSHVHPVAAGASVTFVVDSGGAQGVPAMTAQRDGSLLVTSWRTNEPGQYQLTLAYQVPALAGAGRCPDRTNAATVTYAVAAASAASSAVAWWWYAAGAGVLVVLAVLILLGWRRRRRGRSRGAGATAVAIVVVLSGIGGALVDPPAARANVYFNPGTSTQMANQYAACIGMIQGYDPSLLNTLNGPGSPTVVIYPWYYSAREDLKGGTPRDSFIRWDNQDTSHIVGENGNVNYDPCAELYHEMIHALDAANGKLSNRMCDDTGVSYDEVRATIAENGYRAKYGLPPRTTYDGKPIPSTLAGCTPPTSPPPRPVNRTRHCDTSRCGHTMGDPHLSTIDGYRYDFQAVGEFTAVTSTAGDFTVQVRQAPYLQSRIVAVNTAVALRVGPTRLGFYLANGTIEVHRDGVPTTLVEGPTSLPGGGSVERNDDPYSGEEYDVSWPDGSVVSVARSGSDGLFATVDPAPARAGKLSGLLGNFDGNATNDVTVRAGSVLAQPVTFDALYPAYADSWRVSDADSLFDYAAGQDTRTFTDRSFPERAATVAGLADGPRAAGRAACEAGGVTDPTDLDACVLDVALTGQAAFVLGSADVQNLAPPTDAGASIGPALSATIDTAGGSARLTYTGIKGQRLYVQVVSTTLPPRCGVLTLYAPDGHVLAGGCLDANGGYIDGTLLPADGTYTVAIGPDGTSTGTATVRFIATVDQSVAATIDGPPATATIAAPGGQSRVAFTANAGQKIYVTISGATVPGECGALAVVAPDGAILSGGCFNATGGYIDGTVLPATGQYAIVVNPSVAGTGQITLRITSAVDQQVATSIGATPVTLTIAQPGAVARATFTANAGQNITVTATGSTLPGECGILGLIAPDRHILASTCLTTTGTLGPVALPTAGQYTVVVDPSTDHTGHLEVAVTSSS